MARCFLALIGCSLTTVWVFAAAHLQAQEPAATPSTTQSQSGYPDIRKEAADPTLFPDPDVTARNLVRPETPPNSKSVGGGSRGATGKRVGNARLNDQALSQADADPLPVRISYRRAKTLVMERNPNLQTLLTEADHAGTDVEKRQYLREYYDQLFVGVHRVDSSPAMNSHLKLLRRFVEQRYDPKRRMVAGEEDLVNGLSGRKGTSQ